MSSEIVFKVGKDKAHLFDNFFREFDEKLESLDISSYGISMTTLEEVFIAANNESEDKNEENKS